MKLVSNKKKTYSKNSFLKNKEKNIQTSEKEVFSNETSNNRY